MWNIFKKKEKITPYADLKNKWEENLRSLELVEVEDSRGIIDSSNVESVINILSDADAKAFIGLKDELKDNWTKKQIFRTETEMRVSVLDDVKKPTPAAKYWQAVREMSSMFNSLMELSFDLRRNTVERLKIEQKIKKVDNDTSLTSIERDIKMMSLKIDLDENLYRKASMEQTAQDRMREIKLWSKLKAELDDGSFDTTNPNTHQVQSFRPYFQNRVKSLSANSEPSEVLNAMGLHNTLTRLTDSTGKLLDFTEAREKAKIEAAKERDRIEAAKSTEIKK